MDPMTMMAIANTAMNIFGAMNNKGGGQGGGQGQGGQGGGAQGMSQFPAKQITPGPLPGMVGGDYGDIIKNMMQQNTMPQPAASFVPAQRAASPTLF